MNRRDRDYDLYAGFYRRRVPYAPQFFAMLAKDLGLSRKSFALDLACGTGELAIGLARYCGAVVGVDRSTEMLSARRASPANVRFVKADLNAPKLQTRRPADLVTIGRALHYLNCDTLLPFLSAATRPSAHILVCNTAIHGSTPWREGYDALLDSYIERLQFDGYYGGPFFAGSEWVRVGRLAAPGAMRWSVEDLVQHALSFPHYTDVLLAHEAEFRDRLRTLLKPHFVAENQVGAILLSDGVVYSRSGEAAEPGGSSRGT